MLFRSIDASFGQSCDDTDRPCVSRGPTTTENQSNIFNHLPTIFSPWTLLSIEISRPCLTACFTALHDRGCSCGLNQLTRSAFLRTDDKYSPNAEPHVSFLYRVFRSGQKHLHAELDCMCLNRFHCGSETFVIYLERCSEIPRVFPKRIGQGCSAKDCHGATHRSPYQPPADAG